MDEIKEAGWIVDYEYYDATPDMRDNLWFKFDMIKNFHKKEIDEMFEKDRERRENRRKWHEWFLQLTKTHGKKQETDPE